MAGKAAPTLTARELAVMRVFWQCSELTADEARRKLAKGGERLSYPTVANVVRGLSEKGFLRATNDKRPFQYQAVRTFDDVSQHILKDVITRLFDGSREAMLVNLLGRHKLSRRERDFLKQLLQRQEG